MSARSVTLAGRRAAERLMTDEWAVYRVATVWNPSTGDHEEVSMTVYLGPGKLQSFESYESNPEAGGHQFTEMRPHLHLPVSGTSSDIGPGDVAVCLSSSMDAALVGTSVTVAGVATKTHMTARRFPVKEGV